MAMAHPLAEHTLDDYERKLQIGRGGFGRVYWVEEIATGRQLAMKECYIGEIAERGMLHYLKREKLALQELDHHFIIKLHAAFQDESCIYFVMDFMKHGQIYDYRARFGMFNMECTRFYTAELIEALVYLRSKNYVHRDIKPENILLDDQFHIKLCDFGCCKRIGDKPGLPGARKKVSYNSTIGTPNCYAPEVIDQDPVTTSTDLWGLGCLIFEFHTGQYCFASKPEETLYTRIKNLDYFFPEACNSVVKSLVKSLMVVDPTKRLGATEFKELKAHPFYHDIDFEHLHVLTPPSIQPPEEYDARRFGRGVMYAGRPDSFEMSDLEVDVSLDCDWDTVRSPTRTPEPIVPPASSHAGEEVPVERPSRRKRKCCTIM